MPYKLPKTHKMKFVDFCEWTGIYIVFICAQTKYAWLADTLQNSQNSYKLLSAKNKNIYLIHIYLIQYFMLTLLLDILTHFLHSTLNLCVWVA